MGKVVFGIKNVHYAVWDEETGEYGTPVHVPGAVSLSITREGNNDTFYADNRPFASFITNAGYTGELEMAYGPAQMLIDLVGYKRASNGVVYEAADAVSKSFALLYEVDSNESAERFAFYNVTVSRPEGESNTTTDSTEPDTQTFEFTAIPREMTVGSETANVVKGWVVNEGDTAQAWADWYKSVQTPAAA